MTQEHPITLPPELVQQWWSEETYDPFGVAISKLATQAARWGADQELDACCEWLDNETGAIDPKDLRAERRPKLLSLKELALASVKRFEESGEFFSDQMRELEFIRKALEQLDD